MHFRGIEPLDQEEADFAEDFIVQTLADWVDAGNAPATLFNAMVKVLVDIQDNVAKPIQ